MSRLKSKPWSVRFELSPDNPNHVKLHNYLIELAITDNASDWMRNTLIAALPATSKPTSSSRATTIPPITITRGADYYDENADSEPSELRYAPLDE